MKFAMIPLLFLAFIGSSRAQQPRHEILGTGLNGPFYMRMDNGDLLVTFNEELVKIQLTAGRNADNSFPIETQASVPGAAIGFELIGPDFLVMEEETQSIVRVSRNGERHVLATGFDNIVEIVRYKDDYIVTDYGLPAQAVGNRLLRVSGDGTVSVIATGPFVGIGGLAVVGDKIYVTDFNLGSLFEVSLTGETRLIASGLNAPVNLQWDGQDFIVSDFGNGFEGLRNGRVLRVSLTGRVSNITSGVDVGNPAAIALLGSDIIYSDLLNGQIGRLNGYRLRTLDPQFKK